MLYGKNWHAKSEEWGAVIQCKKDTINAVTNSIGLILFVYFPRMIASREEAGEKGEGVGDSMGRGKLSMIKFL